MRNSQITSNAVPVRMPIVARMVGLNQPCSTEYFRKNTAASTSAIPAIHENSFTPTRLSQSNAGFAGGAGRGGGGMYGGGSGVRSAVTIGGAAGGTAIGGTV